MNIFNSFADWIGSIGSFIQSLYESNPNAFMTAVFAVILILIVIIVALARAKRRAEGHRAIKYEDIDFSTEAERKAASASSESPKTISRGLPEPATEEELRPKYGAFDVPTWMTKQTMSLDEADMMDAEQWIGEQLDAARHTDIQGAEGDTLSAVEFAAAAATGVIMSREPGEPLREVTVKVPDRKPPEPQEPAPAAEEEVIHLNRPDLSERGAVPEEGAYGEEDAEPRVIHLNESNLSERITEPVITSGPGFPEEYPNTSEAVNTAAPAAAENSIIRPDFETAPGHIDLQEPPQPAEPQNAVFDTDTLAKIMKEQEEMAGDGSGTGISDVPEGAVDGDDLGSGVRAALDQAREGESYGTAMSDAIRDEKPGLITMRTLGEDPSAAEVSREYSELLEGNIDFAGNGIPGLRGQSGNGSDGENGRSQGAFASGAKGRIHYGPHNRDTNRSGVKFTEDELMEKIRD